MRQHIGRPRLAQAFEQTITKLVLPVAAGAHHFLFNFHGVDIQRLGRVNAQNELGARQGGFGKVGPELAFAGFHAARQHLLNGAADIGGVDIPRHKGQAIVKASIVATAQEHANLVTLLHLHDGNCSLRQLVDRGLEQVITGQHLQHLLQLLGQMAARDKAGHLAHMSHLAPHMRDMVNQRGIHPRGIKPHKAVFQQHVTVSIYLPYRDIVRVRRPMHTAQLRGLGKRQQQRRLQIGRNRVRQTLKILITRVQCQRTQAGVSAQAKALLGQALVDGKALVAQKGEMVIQQPFEKGHRLGPLVAREILFAATVELADQRLHPLTHGAEVLYGGAHRIQRGQQAILQGAEIRRVGGPVNLDVHDRFSARIGGLRARRKQLLEIAALVTLDMHDAVVQVVNGIALAGQLHAHRIDQKRQITMQHLDNAVGALPAMLLGVGVEHPQLHIAPRHLLHKAPGRQGAAQQICILAHLQLCQRGNAKELAAKLRHSTVVTTRYQIQQTDLQLLDKRLLGTGRDQRHLASLLGVGCIGSAAWALAGTLFFVCEDSLDQGLFVTVTPTDSSPCLRTTDTT